MEDLNVLINTNPGLVALGILALAIIFLFVFALTKRNIYVGILDLVLWTAAVATIAAVLGIWDIPFIDYFNVPATAST
jgi:hypothetical protein